MISPEPSGTGDLTIPLLVASGQDPGLIIVHAVGCHTNGPPESISCPFPLGRTIVVPPPKTPLRGLRAEGDSDYVVGRAGDNGKVAS